MSKAKQTLGEEVLDYLWAGFPALWIHSMEQEEAVEELKNSAYGEDFPMVVRWDCAQGLRHWVPEGKSGSWLPLEDSLEFGQALATLERLAIESAQAKGTGGPDRLVAIFCNANLVLNGNAGAIRAQQLLNYLQQAEQVLRQRFIVVGSAPSPPEMLKPVFTTLQHRLPDREQLREILHSVATEEGDLPGKDEVEAILDAARGLTRTRARNTFSLCLVRPPHQVQALPVFLEKAKAIKGNDLGLEVYKDTSVTFDDIVGLAHVKQCYTEMMQDREWVQANPLLRSGGIVLAGVPGVGKSLFCRAAGNSVSPTRPTLKWRMALTGSKYVSEGAAKMWQVINILCSMAPCNVQVDEGGKAKAASTSGEGGSSVQAGEMDSLWLEFHEETEEDIYPIFTMNQEIIRIAEHQPEFLSRFDAVFFMDIPSRAQLDQLWQYHLKLYGLIEDPEEYFEWKKDGRIPIDTGWVGRDVRNCCRQAARRRVDPAAVKINQTVRPGNPMIQHLREKATEHGWLSAEYAGEYNYAEHEERVRESLEAAKTARDTIRRRKPQATTS